jgi:hypothetical protein
MIKTILLLILAYAVLSESTSTQIISFSGGYCKVCSGDYSCTNGYGNWTNQNSVQFNIPKGNIVSSLSVTLNGVFGCASQSSTFKVLFGDKYLGTQTLIGQCGCGTCDQTQSFTDSNVNGLEYFKYDVSNILITEIIKGLSCISFIDVTITYKAGTRPGQENLQPNCTDACINGGNCIFDQNMNSVCNCTQYNFGPNCECHIPSYPTITDNAPILSLSDSGFKQKDILSLRVKNSVKYFSTKITYKNEINGTCDYILPNENLFWTKSYSQCLNLMDAKIPWSIVYPKCVCSRTEDNSWLYFTGEMNVENQENVYTGIRNLPVVRTIKSSFPFQIRFPKSVSISSNSVNVYSFVGVDGTISQQVFIAGIPRIPGAGKVVLFTTVQYPYKLVTPNIFSPLLMSSLIKISDSIDGVTQCNDDGTLCKQFFTIDILPDTNMCKLDGDYFANFTVICQPSYNANCSLDSNTNSATIKFTLASENFCLKIIDSVDISGSLTSWQESTRITMKNDFIFGQTLFFKGELASSKMTITQTSLTVFSVTLWNGKIITLFNNGVTSDGSVVNFQFDMSSTSTKVFFSMNINPIIFNVQQDTSQAISFNAQFGVIFQNTGLFEVKQTLPTPKSFKTTTMVKLSKVALNSGSKLMCSFGLLISLVFFIL